MINVYWSGSHRDGFGKFIFWECNFFQSIDPFSLDPQFSFCTWPLLFRRFPFVVFYAFRCQIEAPWSFSLLPWFIHKAWFATIPENWPSWCIAKGALNFSKSLFFIDIKQVLHPFEKVNPWFWSCGFYMKWQTKFTGLWVKCWLCLPNCRWKSWVFEWIQKSF